MSECQAFRFLSSFLFAYHLPGEPMNTFKDKTGTFRISRMEFESLQRLCNYEVLNLSEAIRLAIREAAQRRGLWNAPEASQNGHTSQPEALQGAESEGSV